MRRGSISHPHRAPAQSSGRCHSHCPRPKNLRFPINPFPLPPTARRRPSVYAEPAWPPTAKSTGPRTPEGKRISSQNAARHRLPPKEVLKGQSLRRVNDLAAALTLQFQPRNSAETSLIRTMAVARCLLQRIWGTQTAAFQREIDRLGNGSTPFAGSGAVLAAAAFRSLADNSPSFGQQHRLEAIYDRDFNQALAKLLKLRKTPPLQLATESRHDDFQTEANIVVSLSSPLPKSVGSAMNELRSSLVTPNALKARPNSARAESPSRF